MKKMTGLPLFLTLSLARVSALFMVTQVHSAPVEKSNTGIACKSTSTMAEKIVCGSKELQLFDALLAKQSITKIPESFIKQRKICEYSFDCIKKTYVNELEKLGVTPKTIYEYTQKLQAFSWGGYYRDSPSLNAIKLGYIAERQPIKILEKTEQTLDGYSWFKIEANGKIGYQWGGILCSANYPTSSYCM